jgi:glutathione S-transferase
VRDVTTAPSRRAPPTSRCSAWRWHFEPAAEQDRWRAREWLSWEAADAIINVAKMRHYHRFRTVDPAVMAFFRPPAEAALTFIDRTLADRQCLVGETCSIADIGCWGPHGVHGRGRASILGTGPISWAWSERLKAMPDLRCPTI